MALATLGILSIGDMGLGIAKLLVANNYRVITNATGRRYAGITEVRTGNLYTESTQSKHSRPCEISISTISSIGRRTSDQVGLHPINCATT